MIRESSAVAARQNLGDLLNQVQYRNDAVLITKDGKPVAALVDVALFEPGACATNSRALPTPWARPTRMKTQPWRRPRLTKR